MGKELRNLQSGEIFYDTPLQMSGATQGESSNSTASLRASQAVSVNLPAHFPGAGQQRRARLQRRLHVRVRPGGLQRRPGGGGAAGGRFAVPLGLLRLHEAVLSHTLTLYIVVQPGTRSSGTRVYWDLS